jgi:hypothetical protein
MKVRGYGGHSILKSVLDGNVNSHLHATGHIQGDATRPWNSEMYH